MKKTILTICLLILLTGCNNQQQSNQIEKDVNEKINTKNITSTTEKQNINPNDNIEQIQESALSENINVNKDSAKKFEPEENISESTKKTDNVSTDIAKTNDPSWNLYINETLGISFEYSNKIIEDTPESRSGKINVLMEKLNVIQKKIFFIKLN